MILNYDLTFLAMLLAGGRRRCLRSPSLPGASHPAAAPAAKKRGAGCGGGPERDPDLVAAA